MSQIQDYFSSYGVAITASHISKASVRETTYSPLWVDKYFDLGFQKIDPIISFALRHSRRDGSQILTLQHMKSPLFEEAATFDAASNVMVTSYIGGSTMIVGGTNTELKEQYLDEVENACKEDHWRVIVDHVADLTDPQIDLMELSEQGLTDNEVAHELGVTVSAIAQRKQCVCRMLGVKNFRIACQAYGISKWGHIVGA